MSIERPADAVEPTLAQHIIHPTSAQFRSIARTASANAWLDRHYGYGGFFEMIGAEMLASVGTPACRGYGADTHSAGLHLLSIVSNLLDMAKISSGKFELHETNFRVRPIMERFLILVRQQAEAAGIELETSFPRNPPSPFTDETRFRQILVNLLSNAVYFTPQGDVWSCAPGSPGSLLRHHRGRYGPQA